MYKEKKEMSVPLQSGMEYNKRRHNVTRAVFKYTVFGETLRPIKVSPDENWFLFTSPHLYNSDIR